MFQNLFSKKTSPAADVSPYKQARDMYSSAFHIEKGQGNPLCGTANAMYGNKVVTVDEVLNSLDKQHGGWHWCAGCGSAFTGEPESVFIETRYSRGK
jgi:hypothetical protein